MNDEMFWNLIEGARLKSGGAVGRQIDELVQQLSKLSVVEIIEFENGFVRFLDEACDEKLWAAGSIIDELSDDGFWDFRAWIILQGKESFLRCLENPETLASMVSVGDRITAEEMCGVSQAAYRLRTGNDDFSAVYRPQFEHPPIKNANLSWKTADGYPDTEVLSALFPILWQKFRK